MGSTAIFNSNEVQFSCSLLDFLGIYHQAQRHTLMPSFKSFIDLVLKCSSLTQHGKLELVVFGVLGTTDTISFWVLSHIAIPCILRAALLCLGSQVVLEEVLTWEMEVIHYCCIFSVSLDSGFSCSSMSFRNSLIISTKKQAQILIDTALKL